MSTAAEIAAALVLAEGAFIGPEGPRGPQGVPGVDGQRGPMGPKGPKGDKGDRGNDGSDGKDGPRGIQGPAGDRGERGLPGPASSAVYPNRGLPGPIGATGAKGDTGVKGDKGDIGPQGPQGETAGQVFFFHHATVENPAGYEGFERIPANSVETDESVSVSSATGAVLIDKYITSVGQPGVTVIKAGLWYFDMFHYVDSIVGVTTFRYDVHKYEPDTTETLLFSVTSAEVNALAVIEVETQYAQALDITMNTDDRISVHVYALSTKNAPALSAHFVYEGVTHASHVHTTIGIQGVIGPPGPPATLVIDSGVPSTEPGATELPIYINSATGFIYIWNGTAWFEMVTNG